MYIILYTCVAHVMYSWKSEHAERLLFGGPDVNSRIKFEPRTLSRESLYQGEMALS